MLILMIDKRIIKRAWISIVLAYAAIRTLIIWKIFAKYGVNPYAYLAVDIVSAYFYAIYSTRLIEEIHETHYKKTLKYLFLTALFNFIPDIFILVTAKEVPKALITSFIQVIIFLALVAGFSLIREYRKRFR